MLIDPKLLDYATDRQREYIAAVNEHGGARPAANVLGVHHSAISRAVSSVKAKAAQAGYAPANDWTRPVPDGFRAKGVSTYYNAEGKPTGQWVKASADNDRQREMLLAMVEAAAKDVVPVPLTAKPSVALKHLLTLYTFTDLHVGMLAWHKEGGDDWDLAIAEKTGVAAMHGLVAGAPQSHTAIVNIQGDFMHFDGLAAITPQSGHHLDSDGRFGKIIDVAISLIRQLVSLALQRHTNVILLIAEGNHDVVSSIWLRKLFGALYEKEPRITVHESELPYYAIEWGQTMLGFHHGHLRKNDQLPALFAAQFRSMWGRCPKVYIHTGHRHHKEDKEHSGCRVIQHPTLAARDAYAARGGWVSDRAITAMTFHKQFGEVGTNSITPEMLAA